MEQILHHSGSPRYCNLKGIGYGGARFTAKFGGVGVVLKTRGRGVALRDHGVPSREIPISVFSIRRSTLNP